MHTDWHLNDDILDEELVAGPGLTRSSTQFDLYVRTRELKQLAASLQPVMVMPVKKRQKWVKDNEAFIHQMMDGFVAEAQVDWPMPTQLLYRVRKVISDTDMSVPLVSSTAPFKSPRHPLFIGGFTSFVSSLMFYSPNIKCIPITTNIASAIMSIICDFTERVIGIPFDAVSDLAIASTKKIRQTTTTNAFMFYSPVLLLMAEAQSSRVSFL